MDKETIIKACENWVNNHKDENLLLTYSSVFELLALLKEQEAVVKKWTKEIANNQLAHALKDFNELMSLDEHLDNEYKRGIWDGLQIAWNIISEGR